MHLFLIFNTNPLIIVILETILRLANLLKLQNGNVDKIQIVIKAIKAKTSVDRGCNNDRDFLNDHNLFYQLKEVEKDLRIRSSVTGKFHNLTNEELTTVAEMFIYLNMCPNIWFKFWSSFYNDLFLQTTDKIILTLNRMMKSKGTKDKEGKIRTEKLMDKFTKNLSLRYKEIQRSAYPQQLNSVEHVEHSTASINITDNGDVSIKILFFCIFRSDRISSFYIVGK